MKIKETCHYQSRQHRRGLCATAILATLFGLFPTAAFSNLLLNGGFENDASRFVNTLQNYMVLNPGDTELLGWTIQGQVAWGLNPSDGFLAASGNGFVDLSSLSNQSPNGELSQTIETVPGTVYQILIDRQGFGSAVTIAGLEVALEPVVNSGSWTTFFAEFIAEDALTQLAVKNVSGQSQIVFVDNVSVVAAETVDVPSPPTLSLLGFTAVLMALRRRSQLSER